MTITLGTLMLLLVVIGTAFASEPVLELGTASSEAGQAVTVPLTLTTHGAALAAVSADIGYSPELFTVVTTVSAANPAKAVVAGPAATAAEKIVVQRVPVPGTLRVGIFSPANSNLIGDGVVAYVTFTRVPNTTGTPVLTNTPGAADAEGNPIPILSSVGQ